MKHLDPLSSGESRLIWREAPEQKVQPEGASEQEKPENTVSDNNQVEERSERKTGQANNVLTSLREAGSNVFQNFMGGVTDDMLKTGRKVLDATGLRPAVPAEVIPSSRDASTDIGSKLASLKIPNDILSMFGPPKKENTDRSMPGFERSMPDDAIPMPSPPKETAAAAAVFVGRAKGMRPRHQERRSPP